MRLPHPHQVPASAGARPAAATLREHPPANRTASRQSWMLTFTDLVSLLLTFFVLLFSMSTLEIEKWEAITASLSRSLDVAVRGRAPADDGRLAAPVTATRKALGVSCGTSRRSGSCLPVQRRSTPSRTASRRPERRFTGATPSDKTARTWRRHG